MNNEAFDAGRQWARSKSLEEVAQWFRVTTEEVPGIDRFSVMLAANNEIAGMMGIAGMLDEETFLSAALGAKAEALVMQIADDQERRKGAERSAFEVNIDARAVAFAKLFADTYAANPVHWEVADLSRELGNMTATQRDEYYEGVGEALGIKDFEIKVAQALENAQGHDPEKRERGFAFLRTLPE